MNPTARTRCVFLSLSMAALLGLPIAPARADVAPSVGATNEVIVLGMIHGEHRTSARYSIDIVKALVRAVAPDIVLTEIPPDRLAQARAEFEKDGLIVEPRVSRFPEYVDALFPLTHEMDFEIVATAGWTRPMADARRAALDAIKRDPRRADDWAAYEQARELAEAAVNEGGAPDDPRWIHTDAYDDAVEIELSVYNRLFNDELGAGGWDNINAAHYGPIAAALDRHRGEGKRFLITYGAGHKGWFLRQLRARDDIVLLDVDRFLDQIETPDLREGSAIDCRDGGRTQREMTQCAHDDAASADARMSRLIASRGAALTAPQRADLEANQTFWLRFRDADCRWERAFYGDGSSAPMMEALCRASHTRARIERLVPFLCDNVDATGDDTAPGPCATEGFGEP